MTQHMIVINPDQDYDNLGTDQLMQIMRALAVLRRYAIRCMGYTPDQVADIVSLPDISQHLHEHIGLARALDDHEAST